MPNKVTRQGVRDLGGNATARARRSIGGCQHSWDSTRQYDGIIEDFVTVRKCSLCHEVRT